MQAIQKKKCRWCKTDIGGKSAPLTADQGAELINKALWIPETEP